MEDHARSCPPRTLSCCTESKWAFAIFSFYQVEWYHNICTVHPLQCMGWLLFNMLTLTPETNIDHATKWQFWKWTNNYCQLQELTPVTLPGEHWDKQRLYSVRNISTVYLCQVRGTLHTLQISVTVSMGRDIRSNTQSLRWHQGSLLNTPHPYSPAPIPSSGAAHLEPALCHLLPLTCVFEDPLIGLHHRAEAVEHERPELGRRALRGLVVVEGSVGQDKPALLHLQGGHLVAALNLLMKPAWHGNTNMSLCASLAPMVRTNNFTVILDLLQNKEKKY